MRPYRGEWEIKGGNMPKITVKAKIGDTIHPKYGLLVKGSEYLIEEEEFGEEIFEKIPLDPPLLKGEAKQGDSEKTEKKKGGR